MNQNKSPDTISKTTIARWLLLAKVCQLSNATPGQCCDTNEPQGCYERSTSILIGFPELLLF